MSETHDDLERIAEAEQKWRRDVVEPRVNRFQIEKSPTRFYTPTATRDFDFLEKVGFPGQYPFTAGNNPFDFWRRMPRRERSSGSGRIRRVEAVPAPGATAGTAPPRTTATISSACSRSAAAEVPTSPSTW